MIFHSNFLGCVSVVVIVFLSFFSNGDVLILSDPNTIVSLELDALQASLSKIEIPQRSIDILDDFQRILLSETDEFLSTNQNEIIFPPFLPSFTDIDRHLQTILDELYGFWLKKKKQTKKHTSA